MGDHRGIQLGRPERARLNARDSLEALRAAFEAGVTLFDTAEAYGDGASEALMAKALGDVRDEIVIASKVSAAHLAPTALRAACEGSLRALRTDRIDLHADMWESTSRIR